MTIRFSEDVGMTLQNVVTGEEWDETWQKGSEYEGEVISDQGEYVSFGNKTGVQMHGLKKSQYEVVPESYWPFPDQIEPQWYKDQRVRWDALMGQGWKLSAIPRPFHISIKMENRCGEQAEFSISKDRDFQQIHTWMLERCEEVAKSL